MRGTKLLTFATLMAALANILTVPPLAIPISIGTVPTSIHFLQIPIFISGILAGPIVGFIAGAASGLTASFLLPPKIPFIIGGLAILGWVTGLFAKKLRPLYSGIFAWIVQAQYVAVTDYFWFTFFVTPPWGVWSTLTAILIKLTIEAVIAAVLVDGLIIYIKKTGFSLQ